LYQAIREKYFDAATHMPKKKVKTGIEFSVKNIKIHLLKVHKKNYGACSNVSVNAHNHDKQRVRVRVRTPVYTL
jgi:hypothetical protein